MSFLVNSYLENFWTPVQLGSSLALWLDAADASTITLNGATVAQWGDKSGNGRHATQSTEAEQPTYSASGLGGKPGIFFDGTNDGLVVASWGLTAQPFSRVMAIRAPTTIVPNTHISNSANGIPNTAEYFVTSTSVEMWAGTNGSRLSVVAGERMILVSVLNGAGSFSAKNGIATAMTNLGTNGFAGVRLGGYTGTQGFSATTFQEYMVVQSALSTENRQRLEGYLAHKWGLASNLPSDHPYKTTPPTA